MYLLVGWAEAAVRRWFFLPLVMAALLANAAAQNLVIAPTTTLAAETGNNTSTADSFTASGNGNLGAGNVSKVDIRTLLYAGSSTGIYVHWMPWWGSSGHISIGYDSTDPTEIRAQVDDMLSRGIQGAIVDWYGPNSTHHNTATINLMNEANLRNGQFKFAITEDGGALKSCAGSATCNLTSQIISDLTYAYNTFESSPAYLTFNGRPAVFFFDPDRYGMLDWARVAASVPGKPLFIFQNSGGFTHAQSGGSFSWVGTSSDANNWGQSYLTNFYQTGMQNPLLHTVGSAKKGFNDTGASWGSYRVVNQNCGQTWLNTFSLIGTLYSGSNQLESVQLVTWNDYEEGSELESGIDSCVLVGASLSGPTLNWSLVGGSESILDHYVVFISLDGQNLMPLTQPALGTSSLNLSSYNLAAGTYTLYVKAVGKPTLSNRMSNPVKYTVGDQPPTTTVTITPTSGAAPLAVSASLAAADGDGTVSSTTIDFGDGTVVAGPTATHTYAQPGQYRVVASATDNSGASSASSTLVSATNATPVASLTVSPTSGTAPVTVSADASASYDADGSIATTKIDFGDGTVVSGATASHKYTMAGTYTVKATVIDNFGAFKQASASVTIAGPKVSISAPGSNATVNSPVHLTAGASSGTAITSFTVYDNGLQAYTGSGTALDTSLTLMPDEQHKLTVRATDSSGASGQSSVTIWVADQPPVAALSVTPTSGTVPLTVTASTAGSTDPDGSIVSSTIDFGDGATASGTSASHTYNTAGTYTVTGGVSDGLGGYATATQQVAVNAVPADTTPPTVAITAPAGNSTVSGSAVTVSATATDNEGVTGVQFQLDGANLGQEIASAPYAITWDTTQATNGTHTLTARARDAAGNAGVSAAVAVTVDNTTDFQLASASGTTTSATVAAGGTAIYKLNVGLSSGNTASVAFTCSGAPQFAACSVSPNPATVSGTNPVAVTVTVATTAPSAASTSVIGSRGSGAAPHPGRTWFAWAMLVFPAVVLVPATKNRKRWLGLAALLLTALIIASGCGGGTTVLKKSGGTSAGTYTISVVGSAGGVSHTINLTLTVN